MVTVIYHDVGFRAIYNRFCCFKKEGILADLAQKYLSHANDSNCILTYGYIDHNLGLSVEILACGIELGDNKYRFFAPNDTVRTHARIEAVEKIPFTTITFEDSGKYSLYTRKIENIFNISISNADIEKTRDFIFLDSSRDQYYIDDVLILFRRSTTICDRRWVRIEALKEHSFVGKLLEEPSGSVPFHKNDLVEFEVLKNPNGSLFCVCDIK